MDLVNLNVSTDNGRMDPREQTTADQACTPIPDSCADPEQNDRALKPSKIPILKTKHMENSSANDTSSIKSTSAEEYDAGRTSNVYSSIPTSPITGKKYRSPLSTPVKPLDRSRKLTNGNVTSSNARDNANLTDESNVGRANVVAPVQTDKIIADESNITSHTTAVANCKSEMNSGRDTPNLNTNGKSVSDADSLKEQMSPASNDVLNSERKPKFKWMFGPHKNANVVCNSQDGMYYCATFFNNIDETK